MTPSIRLGTAGWAIPRTSRERFPAEGSTLQRYAARFNAAEINSSFYKSHRTATYERWAAQVPEGFLFAVKAPKEATHRLRLVDCRDVLARFVEEIAALGDRLGPVLIQLPPSLAFDAGIAATFLGDWRARFAGPTVIEPRHPSWFAEEPERALIAHEVGRVAADPAVVPAAASPGGWPVLAYWRLHGSPRMYSSPYGPHQLGALAHALTAAQAASAWCIFDNTMHGGAAANALDLKAMAPGP